MHPVTLLNEELERCKRRCSVLKQQLRSKIKSLTADLEELDAESEHVDKDMESLRDDIQTFCLECTLRLSRECMQCIFYKYMWAEYGRMN